jgi:hypothetical protein
MISFASISAASISRVLVPVDFLIPAAMFRAGNLQKLQKRRRLHLVQITGQRYLPLPLSFSSLDFIPILHEVYTLHRPISTEITRARQRLAKSHSDPPVSVMSPFDEAGWTLRRVFSHWRRFPTGYASEYARQLRGNDRNRSRSNLRAALPREKGVALYWQERGTTRRTRHMRASPRLPRSFALFPAFLCERVLTRNR